MIKKKIINFLLTLVVLVYIVFEELVWDRFAKPIIDFFTKLKILKKLEEKLQKFDSRVILVVFVALFVVVESLGIYAGALFVNGAVLKGVLLYAAKIPIAAFTFWMFNATKEKLLEFDWFKKSYYFTVGLIDRIKHSSIYISIKEKSVNIKAYVKTNFLKEKGSLKSRVSAIYRKLKSVFRG